MNSIKVTIEKDGKTIAYSGEFVVIGMIRDDGEDNVITVATFGDTTAYSAAKLVKPFDMLESISAEDER